MKVVIAQVNPTVGDIDGNRLMAERIFRQYASRDVGLCVFPELFLTGYPPRDLLERPAFIDQVQKAIDQLAALTAQYPNCGLVFGAPTPTGKKTGRGLYNSAILAANGQILFRQHKSLLPSYDVFDEERYFDPANAIACVPFRGQMLGLSVCEDAWNDPTLWPKGNYSFDPIEELARQGCTLFVNISASPFYAGKEVIRYRLIERHAKKHGRPFLFVNQVGANDELIFDGRSLFVDRLGQPAAVLPSFSEEITIIDSNTTAATQQYFPQEEIASIHDALILGIRDYMRKTGFSRAVLGLSGGIDSAVVCVLAVRAIGAENVLGVTMPGPYSSAASVEDSRQLAKNLKIDLLEIPINNIYESYLTSLKKHFAGQKQDITEENLQARIRGNILMAISNKFGYLVLSTGNKSELAVGYCTLYGDMSGGLSVIADVPKTMVYQLAAFINRQGEIIPQNTIDKPPSAELRPGQKDQDTLPPYEVLDAILHYHLEEALTASEIVAKGFEPEAVDWVIKAVSRSEYKRRQAALGLKVTSKAFGTGRRMPIAARY